MTEETKRQLEQYSAEKLARAANREQERLDNDSILDYLLDCAHANNITAGDLLHRARKLELRLAIARAKVITH